MDVCRTAEVFLQISSVYKEDNTEVKSAVLESIGEMSSTLSLLNASERRHTDVCVFQMLS